MLAAVSTSAFAENEPTKLQSEDAWSLGFPESNGVTEYLDAGSIVVLNNQNATIVFMSSYSSPRTTADGLKYSSQVAKAHINCKEKTVQMLAANMHVGSKGDGHISLYYTESMPALKAEAYIPESVVGTYADLVCTKLATYK